MSDERKASLAIFLSILVILTWTNLFMTPPVQQQTNPVQGNQTNNQASPSSTQTPQTNINQNTNGQQQIVTATNDIQGLPKKPTFEDYVQSPKIQIETKVANIQLSTLGGRLINYELKDYRAKANQEDLVSMVVGREARFPLGVEIGGINDAGVKYAVVGVTPGVKQEKNNFLLEDGQEFSVKLQGLLADGNTINKTIAFKADSYLFSVNVDLVNPTADGSGIKLTWNEDLPEEFEEDRYNIKSFVYLDSNNSVDREYVGTQPQAYPEQIVRWLGLGDNYFSVNMLSPVQASLANFSSKYTESGVRVLKLSIEGGKQTANFKVYAGPKVPEILESIGYDLKRTIDFGWFAFIGQPILSFIQFCYNLLGNYGLAIILVTILIKLFLLPLTKTSYKSMQAMQDLQPKVTALRERVKDHQILQQEMLKLYQQNGVNPMAGCLPMLLQIPVFLGMYNALQSSVYLRHADFALWINDLSTPERLMIMGVPVPVMILLMGASMFFQTMLTPTTMDANQKKIMYMMPIMFTLMFIVMPFPSGLVLYWLINNVMSIIQQYALRTDRKIQPLQATIASGILVFGVGYIITLI